MDTNRYYRIPIHVKPHVKKYLTSVYGRNIIISAENPATIVLYSFLKKKTEIVTGTKEEIKKRLQKQNAIIHLYIPKRDTYKYGIAITDKAHFLISRFFEQEITLLLYHITTAYQAIGRSQKAGIEYFCKLHGIELYEDIEMDAIKKNIQRIAEKLKQTAHLNNLANDTSFI